MRRSTAAVVLAGVILVAGGVTLKVTVLQTETANPQDEAESATLIVVDVETGRVTEVARSTWVRDWPRDADTDYKVDPGSGHTMAIAMRCFTCGKRIPPVPPSAPSSAVQSYTCPACGGSAYPPEMRQPPE